MQLLQSFTLAILLGTSLLYTAKAKEIVATHEWQLLSEDDTLPAGLHVRMDLSTGKKWAKLVADERAKEVEIGAGTGELEIAEAIDDTVKGK